MKHTFWIIGWLWGWGILCQVGWLPWWALAGIGAVGGWLWAKGNGHSFWSGFWGGFLLWLFFALLRDVANGGILSARVGALFLGLPRWGLLGVTGLLGGLLSGLGVFTGYRARVWWQSR